MNNLQGQFLGRYHILEPLGQGGMATVYKAYDACLERNVAVKVLRMEQFPPVALDSILKRFDREAKALARLSHPNIVKVLDYGEDEGVPYLVLEYLSGGTLKERLGKPMPWRDAMCLLLPIANALAYAHEQNILHRDVKPSNILLTQKGQPMLTDFGIAKILDLENGETLTTTGVGIGTPEYMSPEQGLGKPLDARTDIYSLGIVLYEAITGCKPFTADTPMAIVFKHLNDPLTRPVQFVPDLPHTVEKVILKALAKAPVDRYTSMAEMVAAMQNVMGSDLSLWEQQTLVEEQKWEIKGALVVETEDMTTMEHSSNVQTASERDTLLQRIVLRKSCSEVFLSQAGSSFLPAQQRIKGRWLWIVGSLVLGVMLYLGVHLDVGMILTMAPTQVPSLTLTQPFIPVSTFTPVFTQTFILTSALTQAPTLTKTATLVPAGLAISSQNVDQVVLLNTLKGHINHVDSISFSPNGDTLASGSWDGTVRLWKVSDGSLLRTLEEHKSYVLAVDFSPDGVILASGGRDSVLLWQVSDGTLLRTLEGHKNYALCLDFSPDGTILVTGADDRTIRLWRVSDGALLNTLEGHTNGVTSVAFSPDGMLLASASYDNTVRLWRVSDGALLNTLEGHTNGVTSVAFSPDGMLLASASYDNTVRLWRVSDGALLDILEGQSVSFSPNGTLLITGSSNNMILWQVADGSLVHTFQKAGSRFVRGVAFSPDGALLASVSGDHTIRLWGLAP